MFGINSREVVVAAISRYLLLLRYFHLLLQWRRPNKVSSRITELMKIFIH